MRRYKRRYMRKFRKQIQKKQIINRLLFPGKRLMIYKELFRQLGFRNIKNEINIIGYAAFLKSKYWKTVSCYVKQQAELKCGRCGKNKSLVIHHKHYNKLGTEHVDVTPLECVCHTCHCRIHDIITPHIFNEVLEGFFKTEEAIQDQLWGRE